MTGEWEPGDVAVVLDGGVERHAAMDGNGDWFVISGGDNALENNWLTNVMETEDESALQILRPLVVIDPEDREQVNRLADAFCAARWDHSPGSEECDPLTRSSMQIALRSLIAPPRPEEPTGLGAVVVDADGDYWIRTQNRQCPWQHFTGTGDWDDIAAVKVFSEGVQP